MTDPPRTASVHPHKRADRICVEIGGSSYVVAPEFLVRHDVHDGREVPNDVRKALAAESAVINALDRALVLLSHRPRARTELARRLTRIGISTSAVEAALERLDRLGYLDDAAFARQFARGRVLGAGQSRHRIRAELLRKGVERETAEAAIDETLAGEDVDEQAIIDRVAAKKMRSLAALDPPTRRRRLYAFLARRGFDVEDIRRVVERVDDAS